MGKILHRERADGVLPVLQELMDEWEKQLPFTITIPQRGGVRTDAEQAELWAIGRTVKGAHAGEPGHMAMGDVVTKARTVMFTAHGHRGGLDALPILDDGHLALDRKDPRWPETFSRLLLMARTAHDMGLGWGGDWEGFKDWDHFEIKNWRELPLADSPPAVA